MAVTAMLAIGSLPKSLKSCCDIEQKDLSTHAELVRFNATPLCAPRETILNLDRHGGRTLPPLKAKRSGDVRQHGRAPYGARWSCVRTANLRWERPVWKAPTLQVAN